MEVVYALLILVVLFVLVMLARTVRIIPQARAGIVERFGKYKETLPAGLNVVVPFVDRVRYLIDLRFLQQGQLTFQAGDEPSDVALRVARQPVRVDPCEAG